MPGYRPQRLAEIIHRELSVRLREFLNDPTFPPVSITHVEVMKDLRSARISWSPLGGTAPSTELLEAMDLAARRLRGPIARALRVRHAPELFFKVDDHLDDAVRLTSLLGRLSVDRQTSVPTPEGAAETDDSDADDDTDELDVDDTDEVESSKEGEE
jgi:ribosome-binding factor A